MKQNERLLVYAVTGFLALILVVAVLFSREPGKDGKDATRSQGLDQILGQDGPDGAGGDKVAKDKVAKEKASLEGNLTGLPTPGEVSPQQALAAPAPKPLLAADLVAQQLGPSRRDRTVRFVRPKQNDSLEGLVRRWCGARDPYLAETRSLNEDLVVLRVGSEVAVPWVEDEVLLAAIEAQKPKTLVAQDATAGGAAGTPTPAVSGPNFAQPGGGTDSGSGNGVSNPRTPALAAGTSYTVKSGDSLWRIAARTYGSTNVDRMMPAIKDANPGLTDDLRPGQKIVLPSAPAKPAGSGA